MQLRGCLLPVKTLTGKIDKVKEVIKDDRIIETTAEVIADNSVDSVIANSSSVVTGSDVLKGGYVLVTYSGDGGTQPYHYACDYKELSSAEWITAFDYNSQASSRIDGLDTGYYIVNVKIKDSVNQESFKTFVVEVDSSNIF